MNRVISLWRRAMVLFCLGVLSASAAIGQTFRSGLDSTEWRLDPAPLHCRLWQAVPQFGEVGFEALAGEPLAFYVESMRPFNQAGTAKASIAAPFWRPGVRPRSLGELETKTGKRPLRVSADWANRFLNELKHGMSPALELAGWVSEQPVTVTVSPVDFNAAYEGMVNCLASLYPANYEQLRYTTFHYDTNIYGLDSEEKERLDLIAGYLKLDDLITGIVVHAHTDNQGRRGHNWELSRLRAVYVVDYLKKRGVSEDMISMHYWAHTRPKVPNSSAANKAKNRRSYIEMKRAEP